MKRNLNLTAALLMGGMLLVGSFGYAKNNPSDLNKITKQAVENLKVGIKSDNAGLKRSSIYFAGYFRISETVPVLTETLKKESDPKTRILIALVLYKIGDGRGIDLVKEMAENDSNEEVRRMCTCIYSAYLDGNNDIAALSRMGY
jgi:HEAT repeat protein